MQLSQRKLAYDLSRKFMNKIKCLSVCVPGAHSPCAPYMAGIFVIRVGSSPAFVAFLCPIRQDQVGSELQGISYLTSLLFGVQTTGQAPLFLASVFFKISHFLSGQTLSYTVYILDGRSKVPEKNGNCLRSFYCFCTAI